MRGHEIPAVLSGADPRPPDTFAEPWHAQIFSLTVALNESGLFTWPEWTVCFARHLGRNPDDYYLAWLAALEEILCRKNALHRSDLTNRKEAWRRAASRTPHGQPIEL